MKDKVCNMIIDNASCEDVVLAKALEKLQLKTEKYLKPY
jgi:hypothetical protein